MSLTFAQARDEILGMFKTAWDMQSTVPVVYYSDVAHPPFSGQNTAKNPTSVAAITVQHQAGFNAAISNKFFERQGFVMVTIRTPWGEGLDTADALGKVAVDAFQGKATTGGVWFRQVTFRESGQDQMWFETTVSADFEYQEVI